MIVPVPGDVAKLPCVGQTPHVIGRFKQRHPLAPLSQAQGERQAEQPSADNPEMFLRIHTTRQFVAATSLSARSFTRLSLISYSKPHSEHCTASGSLNASSLHLVNGWPQRQTHPIERAGLPITR